jgi:hypothetical protein
MFTLIAGLSLKIYTHMLTLLTPLLTRLTFNLTIYFVLSVFHPHFACMDFILFDLVLGLEQCRLLVIISFHFGEGISLGVVYGGRDRIRIL